MKSKYSSDLEKYPGRLQFYGTKFIRPILDEEEDELLTEDVRKMLKVKKWKLSTLTKNEESVNFELEGFSKLLSAIKQSPADELDLSQNCHNNMIKEITHISFVKLQTLNLSFNRLKNLQKLAYLQAPYLHTLDLSQNKIVQLKSLRKTHFRRLHKLILCDNLIANHSPLTKVKMSKIFLNFKIYDSQDEVKSVRDYDLSWLAKIEPSSLTFFTYYSRKWPLQMKKMKMLKKKYPYASVLDLSNIGQQSDSDDSDDL